MLPDREALCQVFLTHAGWGSAGRTHLAGDASMRRYERLVNKTDGARAVLMDAPPETGEDVRPFVAIAGHLAAAGLSPPKILAEDPDNGFLLLEDFGDALFSRVLDQHPDLEATLFFAAVDVVITLQNAQVPSAPSYGISEMLEKAGLASDWYAFGARGTKHPQDKAALLSKLSDALGRLPPWESTLILRDFHAENLFWLPDRPGPARVGLIDFQDAGLGHPVYDLVSLARDCRRMVSQDAAQKMWAYYAHATGLAMSDLEHAAAAISAQRNLRILGGFARLSLYYGKSSYVDLIPRVWHLLLEDLQHPALSDLRAVVQDVLPAPTQEILGRLKSKCGTIPNL